MHKSMIVLAMLMAASASAFGAKIEMSGSIAFPHAGITLAGGGSQLRGMDTLLSAETGLPVRVCENPETAIVLGTGKQLDSIHLLQRISSKRMFVKRY